MIILRNSFYGLFFYITSYLILVVFFSSKHPGFIRHHGYFLIIFIIAYWIKELFPDKVFHEFQGKLIQIKYATIILIGILLFQIPGTVIATYYDSTNRFSNSAIISEYLQVNKFDQYDIVGNPDAETSP